MIEIRASFFVECEELLEALQDGLQIMDDGQSDDETINVVFRAVHSIKGGAGAFGLEALVRFAHQFESVLDGVRSGNITVDRSAISVFFQSGDILADLVRAARDDTPQDETSTQAVLASLETILGHSAADEPEEVIDDFQPMSLVLDLGLDDAGPVDADPADVTVTPVFEDGYTIHFVPDSSLYVSGNEPLHLLRLLREMGDIQVMCDTSSIPTLADIDEEKSYLSWTIHLTTDEEEDAVREVFDFVADLCSLTITSPQAGSDDTPPPTPERPPLDDTSPTEPPLSTVDNQTTTGATAAETASEQLTVTPVATLPSAPANQDPPTPTKPATAKPRPTVRVDLERIDRLVNLVGELVINQAMISQSVAEADLLANTAVAEGLDEFMQLTRDIQDSVMMIRAQPVKSLFQRMSRIIRESSSMIGKTVRLKTIGDETEVDKTVIERLADPLTHMIRNAVDHGVETPADRLAAGKSEEGIVTLSAGHRSGRVIIEVSDDGAGINRPRVLQIALEKGLVQEGAQLSDAEIDNLLFMPGFSTASEVSDLSGRGVGMDVVKSAILALGGRVTIQSEPGSGTTFTISLPLTLAVLDGMVIDVAQQTLVVPLNTITETLTLTENDIRALGPETSVIKVRNTFVPLLDLGAELGYRTPMDSYIGAIVLLIAQEDGTHAALVVDAIQDQRQVVIKGLQDTFGSVPGVAAATILGDGKIALILDPVDVIAHADGRTRCARANLQLAG
ncbi:MAG: chemotaxis protein CheA [Marinosulfonomonas sp.]|nr:MAG: chemotaxis protein CheA [Marinosulfonomonas sp.]